jgi:hypothetical protein
MFEGFFFVTKIVVVFTNMDPNVRAWSSSYIKFVCIGIFSFIDEIVIDFANVDPNPRAWTSSYVECKKLISSKRCSQGRMIKITSNPWSMHCLVDNSGIQWICDIRGCKNGL